MYLRKLTRIKDGKRHQYWGLMESYRTVRGPRQRTVAYLGEMPEAERLGVQAAVTGKQPPADLFSTTPEPSWAVIDTQRVRTERVRPFGSFWLGLELLKRTGLTDFLQAHLPRGRATVAWAEMAQLLVLFRFGQPSSELRIAESLYPQSALPDLLGVPLDKVNDDRLYRALDELLPHKEALEGHLKKRLGTMFGLRYDVLFYGRNLDVFRRPGGTEPEGATRLFTGQAG